MTSGNEPGAPLGEPESEPPDRRETDGHGPWTEGDASVHLEDLLVAPLAPLQGSVAGLGATAEIELVGPHLRVSGTLLIGQHSRLSDFVNHHEGLMELREATVLRRNGDPTRVVAPSIWVNPTEVTIIGEPTEGEHPASSFDVVTAQVPRGLVVVTPGHTLTGEIYLNPEAELSSYIESAYPPFIPMTDLRARSLADRRITMRYAFALLNRRHIVAATGLQPGMLGRGVL